MPVDDKTLAKRRKELEKWLFPRIADLGTKPREVITYVSWPQFPPAPVLVAPPPRTNALELVGGLYCTVGWRDAIKTWTMLDKNSAWRTRREIASVDDLDAWLPPALFEAPDQVTTSTYVRDSDDGLTHISWSGEKFTFIADRLQDGLPVSDTDALLLVGLEPGSSVEMVDGDGSTTGIGPARLEAAFWMTKLREDALAWVPGDPQP